MTAPRCPMALLWLATFGCAGQDAPAGQPGGAAKASVVDVHHFVDVFRALDVSDSSCRGLDRYFTEGSDGLRAYVRKFDVGSHEMCRAIRLNPDRYAHVATVAPLLDSIQPAIDAMSARFVALYSEARLPAVYFVVGTGMSAGTTTNGDDAKILMGAEFIRTVDRLPLTLAHEFVHPQQRFPWWKVLGAGPAWARGSVLAHSIKEGSANFIAHLVMGSEPAPESETWADAHEAPLWIEFQREMGGTNYARWIYNGWNRKNLGDRPTDLGYYMGYRITKAYYDRAPDKARAIREILSIRDFKRFVKESGYAPRRGG